MSDIVLLVKDMVAVQCVLVNVWLCVGVDIIVIITNSASASSCR